MTLVNHSLMFSSAEYISEKAKKKKKEKKAGRALCYKRWKFEFIEAVYS